MKNFTLKVCPIQPEVENIQPEADLKEPNMAKNPCPPYSPLPPLMPCPPTGPMPMPPLMPCPPMGPQMPYYGGYGMPPQQEPCSDFRLAHAYVPWQYYNRVYGQAEALHKGTLFPELYMPQGEYGPCEGPRPCKVIFGGGVPYGCE